MKVFFIILPLLVSHIASCQVPLHDYYVGESGKGFICISNDSISFMFSDGEYYYGNYQSDGHLIMLTDNLLCDRNYTIHTMPCHPDSMGITLTLNLKPLYFGYAGHNPDTNTYLEKTDRFVVLYDNDQAYKKSKNNTVILFGKDEIMAFEDTLRCYIFHENWTFRADVELPALLGIRYDIIQKQPGMIPFVTIKGRPYSYAPKISFQNKRKK